MNTYQILVFSFSALFSIGYLNFCTSNDFKSGDARIWPNISDNHSFLQFPLPGLTGAGGLDFSFYNLFWAAVNVSRKIPYLVAQTGNFTLLQVAVQGAVGALLCGAAAVIAEGVLYHNEDKYFEKFGHLKRRVDLPIPPEYSPKEKDYQSLTPALRSLPSRHYQHRRPLRPSKRHIQQQNVKNCHNHNKVTRKASPKVYRPSFRKVPDKVKHSPHIRNYVRPEPEYAHNEIRKGRKLREPYDN